MLHKNVKVTDECLEALVYNHSVPTRGMLKLRVYSYGAKLNLNPFFKDLFKERNKHFEKHAQRKWIDFEGGTEYEFRSVDLYQAFLSKYSPDEFANFLEQHISSDDIQSETLVNMVRTVKKRHKIIIDYSSGSGTNLYPLNFSIKELEKIIPRKSYSSQNFRKIGLYGNPGSNPVCGIMMKYVYKLDCTRLIKNSQRETIIDKIYKHYDKLDKEIIIVEQRLLPKLDNESIRNRYNL